MAARIWQCMRQLDAFAKAVFFVMQCLNLFALEGGRRLPRGGVTIVILLALIPAMPRASSPSAMANLRRIGR